MLIAIMALTIVTLPAVAKSAQEIRAQEIHAQKSAEIPVCERSYGALSVLDSEYEGKSWWSEA